MHLKIDGWNISFLVGWPIFREHVSFREGTVNSLLVSGSVYLPERNHQSQPRECHLLNPFRVWAGNILEQISMKTGFREVRVVVNEASKEIVYRFFRLVLA